MTKETKKRLNKKKLTLFLLVIFGILVFVISGCNNKKTTDNTQGTMKNVDMLNLGVSPKYSVVVEDVIYFGSVKGYLARPEEKGDFPGVVMIHEWWGLNDNIKEVARHLASQGYIVLAVDLYGEVATDANRARELVSSLDQQEAIENMRSAKRYLQDNFNVPKVASLGWCFGGRQSLQFALSERLDATVIYYGNLVSDKEVLSFISWPVLGIFGSLDTSIPVSSVKDFESALNSLSIENEIYIYDGVGHAFANPSGMNFAPEQTKDAWSKTLLFLEKNLK